MVVRTLAIISLLFTLVQSGSAQLTTYSNSRRSLIDSLTDTGAVKKLLTHIDKDFRSFEITMPVKKDGKWQHLADSLKIKLWDKADFDNNGWTDLLVVGKTGYGRYTVLCILDSGDQKYNVIRLTRRAFQEFTFPLILRTDIIAKIEYYYNSYPTRHNWDKARQLEKAMLVCRFGDFIEENAHPASHQIQKIQYSTGACYGTCPIFKLEINDTRSAVWVAENFNEIDGREVSGTLRCTIDEIHFKEIIDLLNYIDFEKLNDNYEVGWTDDQSCRLIITYDNDKKKSISDYGLIGTFGLDRLYQLLFQLRANQNWKK